MMRDRIDIDAVSHHCLLLPCVRCGACRFVGIDFHPRDVGSGDAMPAITPMSTFREHEAYRERVVRRANDKLIDIPAEEPEFAPPLVAPRKRKDPVP
jgi:hypothetical protein